jgi:hypothetical protein
VLIAMLKILSAVLAATAVAPSSKFTAAYSDTPRVLQSCAFADTSDLLDGTDLSACSSGIDSNVGYTFATLRVPQDSEILIDLSAQVELFTSTQVEGKRGSKSTAVADAEGGVMLFACPEGFSGTTLSAYDACEIAAPGYVTLNQREQTLSAVLGGIIEECSFSADDLANIEFDLSDCEVARESISLALNTLSAHSFQFILTNVDSGDYEIRAVFFTRAEAEAFASCPEDSPYCLDGDGQAAAVSQAFIGKYVLTAQQVRAVKRFNGQQPILNLDGSVAPGGDSLAGAIGGFGAALFLVGGAFVAKKQFGGKKEQAAVEVLEQEVETEA